MTKFDDIFSSGSVPAMWDMFSSSVSYTPAGGATVENVVALLSDETEEVVSTDDGNSIVKRRTATFVTNNALPDYSGVATIAENATVTIGSDVYAVRNVLRQTSNIMEAVLVRSEQRNMTRQASRRNAEYLRR